MLLGSDGPGGIDFDNAELARTVGVIGLAAILFEGGLSTSWRRLRQVAVPAALLSTVGVAVTTILTGLAARALFDLTWLESFLLGAVVASTDAAAVFATLRYTNIRRRLARTLEAETGGNDPMAIALTIGLIEWIREPTFEFPELVLLVVRELGLGLVVGVGLGALAMSAFAGSSPCPSWASPSAARPRATGGNWSRSTRDSRSSHRWRCSSCSGCSCSRTTCRPSSSRGSRWPRSSSSSYDRRPSGRRRR